MNSRRYIAAKVALYLECSVSNATWNGVFPALLLASWTSAPRSNSCRAASISPNIAAQCSDDLSAGCMSVGAILEQQHSATSGWWYSHIQRTQHSITWRISPHHKLASPSPFLKTTTSISALILPTPQSVLSSTTPAPLSAHSTTISLHNLLRASRFIHPDFLIFYPGDGALSVHVGTIIDDQQ